MSKIAYIDTLPKEVSDKIRSDSYAAHAKVQERLAAIAKTNYERKLEHGPSAGNYWPFFPSLIEIPIKHKKTINWIKQNPDKRLIDRPRLRDPERCLHHRPHRCFHPQNESLWVFVRWKLPYSGSYFQIDEFQPKHIQYRNQSRFCCPEAAYLFGVELVSEQCREIHLIEKNHGWSESIEEYSDRFYGLKPCWMKGGN